jgi:PAS domain S-box-containing protein
MEWQYSPYVPALIVSAAISVAVAFVAWRRRPAPGALPAVLLMSAVAVWALGYALELASATLQAQIFWAKIQYIGIVSVPVCWLVLALDYTGLSRWLTRRNLILLSIIPLLTLLLVWTNELHGLIWWVVAQEPVGSFVALELTYGLFFWVNWLYAYLLLLLGSARFVQTLLRSPQLYRGQAVAVLLGALAPWIGNALYVFGLSPYARLDLTPLAFTISGLALAWAMFRFRLLDLVPVAQGAVIQGLGDGVVVLDEQDRIVDLNPAAEHVIGRVSVEAVGQPASQVLWDELVATAGFQGRTEGYAEVSQGHGEARRDYEVRFTPLRERRGRAIGRLVVFHDVSERKQAEEALRRHAVQLQTAAEVARDAAGVRQLEDLLNRAVDLIRERFGFYHAGLFLVEEQGGARYAVLRAAAGESGQRMLDRGHRLKVGEEGIVGYVTGTGDPRISLDVGEDAVHFDNPDLPETRSEMALPLRMRGEIIGALDVQSKLGAAFDVEDVTILQTMADQLAVAIDNARLLEDMEQSVQQLEAAYRKYTRDSWQQVTRRDGHPSGYRYRLTGVEPVAEQQPEAQRAWQAGVTSFDSERGDGGQEAVLGAAVPIKLRDQMIGVLDLRSEDVPISAETIALVEEVAHRLAPIMEATRLYEDAQRRAARDRLLRDVTLRMRETLDLETLLRTAVDEARRALGLPEMVVRLKTAPESEKATVPARDGEDDVQRS